MHLLIYELRPDIQLASSTPTPPTADGLRGFDFSPGQGFYL